MVCGRTTTAMHDFVTPPPSPVGPKIEKRKVGDGFFSGRPCLITYCKKRRLLDLLPVSNYLGDLLHSNLAALILTRYLLITTYQVHTPYCSNQCVLHYRRIQQYADGIGAESQQYALTSKYNILFVRRTSHVPDCRNLLGLQSHFGANPSNSKHFVPEKGLLS